MGIIETVMQILGSLGVFLYGMKVMGDGIQKMAGERMQRALGLMTRNRFTALFTGIGVTGIIQSSSATTVMAVSFVNAGLLTLVQAVGVIMGANIGTTVTAWIVALLGFSIHISALALPVIGFGLPLLFIKKLGKQHLGEFLIGFGLLFIGLDFLKNCLPDIKGNEEVLRTIAGISGHGAWSHLLFIMAGTLLTIVVQSSSATIAITQTMAFAGWIDFPAACAIVLGENIGTTITAQLASIGTNTNARRAAMAHTMFNVFGVVWVSAIFPAFLQLVNAAMPGAVIGDNASPVAVAAGLALFHTMFNCCNSFILIWFVPQFSTAIEKIVRPKRTMHDDEPYRLKYMAASLQDTPEISIIQARNEVQKMCGLIAEMFVTFNDILFARRKDITEAVAEMKKKEDLTDQMQEEISRFLGDCARNTLSATSAANVSSLIRIVDELESIGDSCYQLILISKKSFDKGYVDNKDVLENMESYSTLVLDFLSLIGRHLDSSMTAAELDKAADMERQINEYRNRLKKEARRRIEHGSNVQGEILFIDKLQQMEHIGDFAFNIAQALAGLRHSARGIPYGDARVARASPASD